MKNNGALFLCKDENHCKKAREAIGIERAMYAPWQSALTGHRFEKVVWLAGNSGSTVENDIKEIFLRERAPTLLTIDGKLIIL